MRSVELFAGAGGLALGCELAGFETVRVVEWDRWACDTLRENAAAHYPLVHNWQVNEGDVRKVDWSTITEPIDLVAGGPPCQPFSMGGKARAADDLRDMFPATAEVIRQLRPRAFIIENVRGLTRTAFANYFEYIKLRLEHPEMCSRDGETWTDHLHRLQREHTSATSEDLTYKVVPTLVNAADYGVPQQRWRVFFVGFRSDVPAEWAFPDADHSKAALAHSQWVTGDYWDRHRVARKHRPEAPLAFIRRAQVLAEQQPEARPWRTVRDAISSLPEPTRSGSAKHLNHVLQPGARSYPGHTGSAIDAPAKALKAGVHGVPGGENMLLRPDGSVRYFTVREAARLQTFPERYQFHGAWSETMRQLGNAVPVLLAQKVAASVAEHLAEAAVREELARRKSARASKRSRATA
ncbi:DNA cytosine methyltransferase [Mycobacterium colombiense]